MCKKSMLKALAIIMALLMIISAVPVLSAFAQGDVQGATVDEATFDEATVDEIEPIFPEEEQPAGTYRYYFYLPDEWCNQYAFTAGVYWWEGSISGNYWPGNEAKSAGVDGVYYYDIAMDTPTIIWNNYLDGGTNSSLAIYKCSHQTVDISTSGYPAGVNQLYPDGLANFDGMIYIITLDDISINTFNNKETYGGEWYYYYGSGQYGTAPAKAEADVVYTDKSFGEWATPDEELTDPVTPVVPTKPVTPVTPATPATDPTGAVPEEDPFATQPNPTETTMNTEPTETTVVPCDTYSLGDVNLDGKLNIKDATAIQKYVAKLIELDENRLVLADFNQDTKINVKDATAIQKNLVGLI